MCFAIKDFINEDYTVFPRNLNRVLEFFHPDVDLDGYFLEVFTVSQPWVEIWVYFSFKFSIKIQAAKICFNYFRRRGSAICFETFGSVFAERDTHTFGKRVIWEEASLNLGNTLVKFQILWNHSVNLQVLTVEE